MSSKTQSRCESKVSQKCRPTFRYNLQSPAHKFLLAKFWMAPSAKIWPLNLHTNLHKRRSCCESLYVRISDLFAQKVGKKCSPAAKLCVICVCFIALQVRQPEKGVAQNQFKGHQFGSEIQQSIAK